MEAREKELKFLATEGKVIIPFFQRTYVWNEENWENLLEGLFNKPEGGEPLAGDRELSYIVVRDPICKEVQNGSK